MSDEEKLQLKKDKWWEIREKEVHIECLRRRRQDQIDALRTLADAWDKKTLSAENGRFLTSAFLPEPIKVGQPPLTLDETVSTLEELGRCEKEAADLRTLTGCSASLRHSPT